MTSCVESLSTTRSHIFLGFDVIGKLAHNMILVVIVGVAYYLIHTKLVGFAAAIAYPDWYKSFAQQNMALSLILFSLVTTVPAAAVAALIAGTAIVRLTTSHRVLWAVLIVIGVTAYSAYRMNLGGSFGASLKATLIPINITHVPGLIAWWTFLPLSIAVFAYRSNRKHSIHATQR